MSTLKVLAHVTTFNAADVIDETVGALCRQTYPIPEILLIDNVSSDGTLDRVFPEKVTVIRNKQNLGIGGAVSAGMEYALRHGYDWIYLLDADSAPEPTAIERLVECYLSLSPELQASTWWLGSLAKDAKAGFPHHGCVFTPHGVKVLNPPPQPTRYRCEAHIWSGSLYRLDTARKVGLPDANYVMDWGDLIYGYEGLARGYTGVVDQSSVVIHHMRQLETLRFPLGTRLIKVYNWSPMRSYYYWRNSVYFWLYKYRGGHLRMPVMTHLVRFCWWLIRIALFVRTPAPTLTACWRGLRDGINGRLENRY